MYSHGTKVELWNQEKTTPVGSVKMVAVNRGDSFKSIYYEPYIGEVKENGLRMCQNRGHDEAKNEINHLTDKEE